MTSPLFKTNIFKSSKYQSQKREEWFTIRDTMESNLSTFVLFNIFTSLYSIMCIYKHASYPPCIRMHNSQFSVLMESFLGDISSCYRHCKFIWQQIVSKLLDPDISNGHQECFEPHLFIINVAQVKAEKTYCQIQHLEDSNQQPLCQCSDL